MAFWTATDCRRHIVRNDTQIVGNRAAILRSLAAAIVVVHLPAYFGFFPAWRGSGVPSALIWDALMVAVPFSLARIAPRIAAFDNQWLPSRPSHWLWFVGMVLLLLASARLSRWLLTFHEYGFLLPVISETVTDVRPATVILRAVILVLLGPIAQEIFWRAYVLAQLRKLTNCAIAILIQSALFTFAHLPSPWALLPAYFLCGAILGIWRIRFRSILPLVLAHMILNGVAVIPSFKTQFDAAVRVYPKCQQIDLLTKEPAEKAAPALIGFMADPDEVVSLYALTALGRNYGREAELYLSDALASSDKRTVDRALLAIDRFGYSGLKPQVRRIVWSSDDAMIRLAATLTLCAIRDEEGLREIAQRHPDKEVRRAASHLLRRSSASSRD